MAEKTLPPSTELTPDEYDVPINGSECVHIFALDSPMLEYSKHMEPYCGDLLQTFNIDLQQVGVHKLDSHKNVISELEMIASSRKKEESLLLLIFWGWSSKSGRFDLENDETLQFYEIWSQFCNENWRNTPKVFLLNVIKSQIEIDSSIVPGKFSTPNEGDILVILKQNSKKEESIYFIEKLTTLLQKYGRKEDISSIVTQIPVHYKKSRPVLISTMLKKLFLIPSEHRGPHLEQHLNNENIMEELKRIQRFLSSKSTADIGTIVPVSISGRVLDQEPEAPSSLPSSTSGVHMGDTKTEIIEPSEIPERRRSSKQINPMKSITNPQRRKSSSVKKPHWVPS